MSTNRTVLLAIVTLTLIAALSPGAGAAPIVVDSFVGDVKEVTMAFHDSLDNGTLSLELPLGADIRSAEVGLEGIPGMADPSLNLSFDNGARGQNIWAHWNEGRSMYPPTVDPENHNWPVAAEPETNQTKQDDGVYWRTDTNDPQAGRPPGAKPFQLYKFKPASIGAQTITVHWNGWSTCSQNRTTPYNAEMWLFNHSSSKWVKVNGYARGGSLHDDWMNHTFDLPSPYLADDRSFDVMIVGCRSEWAGPMLPAFDEGHLATDFIKVHVVSSGGVMYPVDVSFSVDTVDVTDLPGDLKTKVKIGDDHDFASDLQAALDHYMVIPGNVSLVCMFSVGDATAGQLRVSDLRIEYEPVVNQAPTYVGPESVFVDEDADWTAVLDLNAAFYDDHNQGALVFSLPEITDPPPVPAEPVRMRFGTSTSGNRTLEVLPEADYFTMDPLTLSMMATDLFGDTAVGEFELHVTPTADRPQLVIPPHLEAPERSRFNHTFEVDDLDLPLDELKFESDSPYFDIDPVKGEVVWTPGPQHVGLHEFSVTVTDKYGLTDSILARITVSNAPDPPTITSDLEIDTTQGVEATYIIRVEDPDLPHGDVLTYSAFADAIDLDPDPATGMMVFTPTNDHVPSFDVTLRVEDSYGLMDERVLVVNVANVNDPPTFVQLGPQTHYQNDEVVVYLSATDPDLDIELQVPEVLTFTGVGIENFLPVDGRVVFIADQSLVGEHQVTYTVTDRGGLKDVMTVTWTILDVNDVPQIGTDLWGDLPEDEEFLFTMTVHDPDGDTITWSDDTDLFDVDPQSGRIAFTPLQKHVGVHTVNISAGDGNEGLAVVAHTFTIVNVNDAPVIIDHGPPTGSTFEEGEAIDLFAQAEDEDGDDLTLTWREGTKVLGTGHDLRVDDLPAGEHTLTLEVADGNGGTTTLTIEVEVTSGVLGSQLAYIILVIVIVVVVAAVVLYMRTRAGEERPLDQESEEENEEEPGE